jgi:hypothetical protein
MIAAPGFDDDCVEALVLLRAAAALLGRQD